MPRGQLPAIPDISTQRKLPPPVPQPYQGTLSPSVVPGFSDVPGHHGPESLDESYNRLSYHGAIDVDEPAYNRLGGVSHQPMLHPPRRACSTKVLSTTDYSLLHPGGFNRSSSHEALNTEGGIYSDVDADGAYNRLGTSSAATESNYAEVNNTSPNLQARGARPGSYNALRGVEVGVIDHTQLAPLYSFLESGDKDSGEYSQLQSPTTPSQSLPEKSNPLGVTGDSTLFDPHGSVVLDPATQHYEVSPAASPIFQTKFKHVHRVASYEPEESADDFYSELGKPHHSDTTASSHSEMTNYEGLYSSLGTVAITAVPPPSSGREEEQDALLNPDPDLCLPVKAYQNLVVDGPPVPPRRSNNHNQVPAQPPQLPVHRSPASSSGHTTHCSSSEGVGLKPDKLPPTVAPKPKPRK